MQPVRKPAGIRNHPQQNLSNDMLFRIPFFTLLLFFACNSPSESLLSEENVKAEKAAILRVLNEETIAAFSRDYEGWQSKWVQTPYVTKTYMNFADSSMTETLGWEEVNQFVEPDPLPDPLISIDVRVYGDGAWVSYEQDDPARGHKRETRLMERVDGQWKIAGMQTVIYGE
jgi:hypothetical protein